MKLLVVFLFALLAVLATAQRCPTYTVRILTDSGRNRRSIRGTFRSFRRIFGRPNNGNEPGPLARGRREINWDAAAVPFKMPFDFFNVNVPRGLILATEGGEFRVSNSEDPVDDRFDSILPSSLTRQFQTFSRFRLFTPLLSNRFTNKFRIPGSDTVAAVSGFGAVFVDVDQNRVTYLDYFDKAGCLIARVFVPARNRGLSFAGLAVVDPRNRRRRLAVIDRVEVKLGNISVQDFANRYRGRSIGDVVVMDDFIYGEPQ